jgi:hypothetical protein
MEVNSVVEMISAGFGALTSIGFHIIPQLDTWLYTKVPDDQRGYVMLGLSVVVPLAIVGVSCVGLYNLVPCSDDIWKDMVRGWLAFVVANVGLFVMTGDSPAKKLKNDEKLNIGMGRKGVPEPTEEQQ